MVSSGICSLEDEADATVPCWYTAIRSGNNVLEAAMYFGPAILLAMRMRRGTTTARLLKVLWNCIAFACIGSAISLLLKSLAALAIGRHEVLVGSIPLGVSMTTVGILSYHQSFIRRVQAWLMSRGEAATAAAGISELLGGRSIEQLLAKSRGSFKFVYADRILREDMADNKPNPALRLLTEQGSLGHVDAFLSHSWHDDVDKKWLVLQEWREEFKRNHKGKEPRLWIDKYCIDQNNIDDSLACLPIYLAGCTKLLILCGTTYLKRLWCLVEIFVFQEMGGQQSNMEVRLLDHSQRRSVISDESMKQQQTMMASATFQQVQDQLENFDPREAACFTDYDTLRLHGVIEATGCDRIAKLVTTVFMVATPAPHRHTSQHTDTAPRII